MKNISKTIVFLLILSLCLIKRPSLINGIIYGINLWKTCLFPSIFPLLILSDLALSTNIIKIISESIGLIFKKIFNIPKEAAYVLFMSFFTGCPSNAKYIKDLLDNKMIDNTGAIKILSIAQLYNPNLIITITPFLTSKSKLFLIIGNLFCNLLIGLINRHIKCNYYKAIKKQITFSLTNSINNAINTLLNILGVIVTFSALSSIFKINHPLFTGIFEITNGISKINTSEINALFMCTLMLSFGGLSIIYQIKGILKEYKLDYTLYYKSRIMHVFLFLILTLIYIKYCL